MHSFLLLYNKSQSLVSIWQNVFYKMLQTVRYTSFKNVLYLQLIYMIAELGSSTKLAVQDSPPEAWFKSYQFLKTP